MQRPFKSTFIADSFASTAVITTLALIRQQILFKRAIKFSDSEPLSQSGVKPTRAIALPDGSLPAI